MECKDSRLRLGGGGGGGGARPWTTVKYVIAPQGDWTMDKKQNPFCSPPGRNLRLQM